MNISAVLLVCIISAIIVAGVTSHAYAVQFTVFLSPKQNAASVDLTGVRFLTLSYPAGGALANQFNGKSEHVRFTMNAPENVISTINQDIASEKQSPARITNATMEYTGDMLGQPDSLLVSYKLDLKALISNYVLQSSSNNSIIDLNWRSFIVNQPLVVDTPKYGKVNVNAPIGLFQVTHPAVAQQLLNSPAADIMQDPILNFQTIGAPMDNWHFLFDPTGSIAGASGLFSQQPGSRAVSVYALGESSLREGTYTEQTRDASASINGETVGVHASTPPPSAQIQIAGFSKTQKSGNGGDVAYVSAQAPSGTVTATGGFPTQVLLVFGGMMGGIAVFVLFKSRSPKTTTTTTTRTTSGKSPPAGGEAPRSSRVGEGSPF
ncbi:MAG TPA: hypothetical protein VEH06_04090 [Candidatus Bathyarchaeia archaeon]|nr:hypothetical protein [Candidatus Bathyarchaeia archaeon]